jgi:hypothetical protein
MDGVYMEHYLVAEEEEVKGKTLALEVVLVLEVV